MKKLILGLLSSSLIFSCTMKQQVDLILLDAVVYTVDQNFSTAEAVAIKEGVIVGVATNKEILERFNSANIVKLNGAALYPGFNDSHCHLTLLGMGLERVDLRGANSFEEVLERLVVRANERPSTFIEGDGWDQTLWGDGIGFPDNKQLNKLFPDIPIVLHRIDFHAVIVNDAAIRALGVTPNDGTIPAGEALIKNGKFTGVFLEQSADRFSEILPQRTKEEYRSIILTAQKEAFKNGLTSISGGGEEESVVETYRELNTEGALKLKTDIWLAPTKQTLERYPKPFTEGAIRVGTIKLFADGALGSRGALLLEPYSDSPNSIGLPIITKEEFSSLCRWAYDREYQVAIHAIGDSANRFSLETYAKFLEPGNDRRWRIEHSQIVNSTDIELFGKYSIVPSIQPTHATSDMFWADERLGERIKYAYRYKELLAQNGWLPSGTDFPIEEVNPIYTFFAAVVRKNINHLPKEGFQLENALSREEALRSMTIWGAKATFEEALKGSIEVGKFADLVVLDQDIMKVDESKLLNTKVVMTFVNGELVYSAP